MVRELLICVLGRRLQQIIRSARCFVAIKYYVETMILCLEAYFLVSILKMATGTGAPAL